MSTERYKNVNGKRIRDLRKRMNISAESFGRRCNISANQLFLIEDGKSPVTEALVSRILNEFGSSNSDMLLSWLSGETDDLNIRGVPLGNQEERAVERLRQVFEKSGLSQREFCKRLGVSSSNLTYIFAGKQKFTENFARKIESEFKVGADWLLYGDETAKNYPLTDYVIYYLKSNEELRKMIWQMVEESEASLNQEENNSKD